MVSKDGTREMSDHHQDANAMERETHIIWLVADPDTFELGNVSPRDVMLPLGLTRGEWREIFFVVLDVDRQQLEQWRETGRPLMEFEREIPGYPMLSQISDIYGDVAFALEEVNLLDREISELLSRANAFPLAARGLKKLLTICREARKLNLSIFMMCD